MQVLKVIGCVLLVLFSIALVTACVIYVASLINDATFSAQFETWFRPAIDFIKKPFVK